MGARSNAEVEPASSAVQPDTVDAYIAAAPPEAAARLQQVRSAMREAAPGAEECISYRIPTLKQQGPLAYFAAFAGHLGVYPVSAGIRRWMAPEVERYGAGKGTLRFPFSEALPLDVISRFVRIRLAENLKVDDAHPDLDIISSRWFDTPREELFHAFTDAETLARWWGPAGFTSRFIDFAPRTGGSWTFVMEGPNGSRYEMSKKFVEVVADERIVLEHLDATHHFVMTMSFATERRGTRLTWRAHFHDAAHAAIVRVPFALANEENFDRLEVVVAQAPAREPAVRPGRKPKPRPRKSGPG